MTGHSSPLHQRELKIRKRGVGLRHFASASFSLIFFAAGRCQRSPGSPRRAVRAKGHNCCKIPITLRTPEGDCSHHFAPLPRGRSALAHPARSQLAPTGYLPFNSNLVDVRAHECALQFGRPACSGKAGLMDHVWSIAELLGAA
jgi:hypothetical protein